MSGPPPPPPPHGENPKTTSPNLPPGKYDIFIIPPHSAGSGFLYLPSLQPNVNSFAAGFASALLLVVLGHSMAPAFKTWWNGFQGMGSVGIMLLVIGVAMGAWSLGRTQTDGGPGSGAGPGGSGGWGSSAGGNFNWNGAGGAAPEAGGPPPQPPPHGSGPPPQSGPTPGGEKPKNSWQQAPQPEEAPRNEQEAPPPKPEPEPQPKANPWEKAREETRKREAERKAKEAEQKRKEDIAKRLKELREKEARERAKREQVAKEKIEKEAQEKAQREKAAKDKADQEAKEKEQREKDQKAKELKEKLAKEKELRDTRLREARERDLRERLEREKNLREKLEKEAKEREATRLKEVAKEQAEEAIRKSTYAFSSAGEKFNPWPNGRPPAQPTPAAPNPNPSSTKRPPAPTAKTFTGTADEETYSYRPYDEPKRHSRRRSGETMFTESSYAPSQSTARTSPPPSMRGEYSTKDPNKIVIKAVYGFMNQFAKTPASQLLSGQGSVTDGLILRITTEGLFIDDDVRGVPQREWDVKAWTLKLMEVWCSSRSFGDQPAPQAKPTPNVLHRPARTRVDRGVPKVLTGEDADKFCETMLRTCKDECRLCPHGDYESSYANPNPGEQSGEWKQRGLHVLRATIRDQEGKRYMFVLGEDEGWKVALGLQRLRKGTQVRQLGVQAMSAPEARNTLETLGWT
ncbi:hypothetical protein G7054_g9715 [Neopestalotiopsis clavispora]|nr:hypothetical protein G7054_g9715 [Neopestalotiopsis clavispora]